MKDKEAKEKELQKLGPPPLPKYNQKNYSNTVVQIEDMFNEPGRWQRPEKWVIMILISWVELNLFFFRLCIFIRGAPGSGKSFLAHKILEKERQFATKRIKFCTTNKYYQNMSFNKDEVDKYINNLHSEVQDLLTEGFYTFFIVEFEGAKLDVYNQLAALAKAGGYEVYGIDINQEVEISKKYVKHNRSNNDIEEIAKGVYDSPVPYSIKVINPTELIDPGWKARQPPPKPKTPSPPAKKRYGRLGRRQLSSDSDSEEDCFVCY